MCDAQDALLKTASRTFLLLLLFNLYENQDFGQRPVHISFKIIYTGADLLQNRGFFGCTGELMLGEMKLTVPQ